MMAAQLKEVTATKFTKNFGRYQDEAQSSREPIRVTNHGRLIGGWLSADELAHFERLKKLERHVHRVGELPDDIVAAIEDAEYGVGPQ